MSLQTLNSTSPGWNSPYRQQQQQSPNQYGSSNRYIPPTFNWGTNAAGQPTNYSQMNWNTMQDYYMPQQTNNPYRQGYMNDLQGMLGGFSQQYGGPNRNPYLQNFSSYNPGFGGPTSYYDQMMAMQQQYGGRQGGGMGQGYGGTGMQGYMRPQFNPYMLAQNNMQGMPFNQMFDPRYASLYGGGGLGSLTPNSQQPGTGDVNVTGATKPFGG